MGNTYSSDNSDSEDENNDEQTNIPNDVKKINVTKYFNRFIADELIKMIKIIKSNIL